MAIAGSFTGRRSDVAFIELDWAPLPAIVARDFDKMGVDIRSFREPLHRAVKQVMTKSLRQNFDAGGRPTWTPLTDATEARKRYKGTSGRGILVDSGRLRRKAGQINLWKITRDDASVVLPGDIFYGGYHQEGWSTPDGVGAPARPWAMIQTEDANDIEEIFFDWIEERMARAGISF